MQKPGKLIVITGPMFAGKTTKLIAEIQKASKKKRAVLFKSEVDTRSGAGDVTTHDGIKMNATVLPQGDEGVKVLRAAGEQYDVIGIDEGQFWKDTPGFTDAINELVFSSKSVYVAVLNKRADGAPFDISRELIPTADKIYSLEAKCSKCGSGASFSQRMINGSESFGNEFMVGGKDLYEARCRAHYVRKPKAP